MTYFQGSVHIIHQKLSIRNVRKPCITGTSSVYEVSVWSTFCLLHTFHIPCSQIGESNLLADFSPNTHPCKEEPSYNFLFLLMPKNPSLSIYFMLMQCQFFPSLWQSVWRSRRRERVGWNISKRFPALFQDSKAIRNERSLSLIFSSSLSPGSGDIGRRNFPCCHY